MQFVCDSCKATLQIADDKVKGKRLVVRCKKCGNRITISDPALGAPAPAVVVAPAPARPAPAPAPAPAKAAAPEQARDSDTEDTRAMESAVLEEALRASKADDTAGGFAPVSPDAGRGPAARQAPPPVAAPPPPRDPPVWFAMVSGKQTGPMSRAELGLKTASGATTARTYVWKEGMAAWQRAKEVAELSSLFADAPAPKPEPKPAPARRPEAPKRPLEPLGAGLREFGTQDFGEIKLSEEEARRARQQAATQDFGGLDLSAEAARQGATTGVELDLDLGKPAPKPASAAARPAPAPARPAPAAVPQAGGPEQSAEGLPKVTLPAHEAEERTSVEALPLGERVHQEAVAQELFASGESSGVSAVDLAKWASSELAKKAPSSPGLQRAPPPTPNGKPTPAATAPAPAAKAAPAPAPTPAPPATAKPDPFAAVRDAPTLQVADSKDRTGEILKKSGVHQKRTPLIVALIGGGAAALALLVWAVTSGDKAPPPAAPQAEKQARGGSGDTSVGGLAKAPPPDAALAGKAPPVPAKPKDPKAPAGISPDQEAAMKALDNERGIGSRAPKAEAAPPPEKADGTLTAADIKQKLGENRGALQGCIDEALRKDPALKVGKIRIATTIAASGQVTAAKIDKKSVDESALGGCLKKATRRIVFPSFSGEAVEVDIPIVVTAGE